jgi:hypothetical protein
VSWRAEAIAESSAEPIPDYVSAGGDGADRQLQGMSLFLRSFCGSLRCHASAARASICQPYLRHSSAGTGALIFNHAASGASWP